MATVEQGKRLRAAGPVRITLPAKVAYDAGALKESIRSVVERLGCPTCFSGANCFFEMERAFVVGPDRRINPDPTPWQFASGPNPEPALAYQTNVALAPTVKYDINKVFQAVDKVIDLLGHTHCLSGFDTLFRDEVIVVNERLEAARF